MKPVVVYVEGGSSRTIERLRFRQGMQAFLGRQAEDGQSEHPLPKIVACGSRDTALRKFREACSGASKTTPILLVDSEGPVDWGRGSAREHLQRVDDWDLRFTDDRSVHLMVQFMETWIIADPDTVAAYYGKGFRKKALPAATDPEQVGKSQVLTALKQATAATRRRRYDKTRDAPALLERLDSRRVAARCRGCARLFAALREAPVGGLR